MDLKPGFYRCDRWPHWFMVNVPRLDPAPCVWGFSIWKNVAGYRTLGVRLAEWLSRDEQKGIVIEPDHDRTADKKWLREYRAAEKAKKPPTAVSEVKTLRAENAALRAVLLDFLAFDGRNGVYDAGAALDTNKLALSIIGIEAVKKRQSDWMDERTRGGE